MTLYREITDEERRTWSASRYTTISAVPVEPDDVMNAAHKLVHPMYDNAADCDKFWCEPFRALKTGIGETP